MKQKIMKHILLYTLILVGLSSCGDSEELTLIGEDSATLNAIAQLKGEYEQETGTKIKIVALPFEEAIEKSNLDLSQGTGLYDIILQYNFSLSPFVRNDYVYGLDELTEGMSADELSFESDLFQADWEEVGYYYQDFRNPEAGIKKVGYPFASNTMLLVYQKDWFENSEYQNEFRKKYNKDLKVPTTWQDVREIAEFFNRPQENIHGIVMEGAEGGWLYYQWVNMLYGMGGQVMEKQRGWEGDENTPVHLDSKEAITTMEMLLSLKPYNKGAFYDMDMYTQKESMKEGNVAIAVMWSDILYDLLDLNDMESSKFGFAPVPGDKSMNAGGAFFVNKKSTMSKEAMKFIAWLMKEENQVKMLKKGLCSPRKSAYESAEVQNIPYLKALKESLDRGVYMAEAGPDADVISQNITKYAQKVWKGELTAEQATKQLSEDVKKGRTEVFANLEK